MADTEVMQIIERSANEVLVWVGFGTIVGLTAKAIMPGRDPGGAVATVLMGIAGTVIGCGSLLFFLPGHRITPVSIEGFAAATAGAFILLVFYRLFAGSLLPGVQQEDAWLHARRTRKAHREVIRELI